MLEYCEMCKLDLPCDQFLVSVKLNRWFMRSSYEVHITKLTFG